MKDAESCRTSNATITYYLGAPKFIQGDTTYSNWYQSVVDHTANSISTQIYLAYQGEENGYSSRSFEDAFINVNFAKLKDNIDNINGLKNIDDFDTNPTDMYTFTHNVLDEKSDFASSLLFLAHAKGIKWQAPQYIKEGFEWLLLQ